MNWKIILQLSLFGLIMAVATVSLISMTIEPFFWLVIFLFSAFIIAKTCKDNFFLHGFMLSLVNCVWITTAHVLFYNSYILHHPQMASMPLISSNHPRASMAVSGIFIGAACGLIVGLLAFIASKIFTRKIIAA